MEVIIQGAISALGYLENNIYQPEPDCFETIRDIIRFLRNDNEELLARRICGERNIIQNDLIPIMKSEKQSDKMFDITLRLMANLVQPTIVSLQGKQPEDRTQWQTYWALDENLIRTKLAFADKDFFIILKEKLEKYFLETEWDNRHEESRLLMERIIVLLRYIFSIPTNDKDNKRTTTEYNSHDRVIESFLESEIHKVLFHIGSQSKERDFHLSILEIFALVVKEHKPADLFNADHERTADEKMRSELELQQAFENEKLKTSVSRKKVMSSRHSRFSGSYIVKGLSAVNRENDFVLNKALKDVSKLTFLDERKSKKVTAKNRRPFEAQQKTHVSSMNLRLRLKKFVEDILEKTFNRLMKSTKELAFGNRRSIGQRNADIHYFLLMRFFVEYCRLAGLPSTVVSNCLGIETFHHLQIQLDDYMERAAAQRKEGKYFGIRAQYALSAYKEMILMHQHLLDRGTQEEKNLAQSTCFHILNVEEYRELGCALIRKFMPGSLSKTFLQELVLLTHYYCRLLERSVKSGTLKTIKKKSKIRKPRKGSYHQAPKVPEVDRLSDDDLDERWAELSDELSDVIMGHLEPSENQIPINALLNVEDVEHQKFAMLNVQRAMREMRICDAVGLFRAARDVWLCEGVFGLSDIEPEDEFLEMREIYFANLDEVAVLLLNAERLAEERIRNGELINHGIERFSDEMEEDDRSYEIKEVDFNFTEYIVKFARTDVLRWYIFLLKDFATNSVDLNKALVKMLHRVTFDLNMPSRLYQLSLFRIFMQVWESLDGMDKENMKKSNLYELYTFGYHLLKRFFATFEKIGEKLVPEILFWKSPKDCYEIEHGYGTYERDKTAKGKDMDRFSLWTEDLEDNLRSLYNEYRDMDERPDSVDVVDFIEHNLSHPRTRSQILKKMKEFGLDSMGAKLNKGSVIDRNFPIIQMKRFIDEFNTSTEHDKDDLVDFLRKKLSETHSEFTRQKILKHLTYLGITYEKKAKGNKSKWSDDLRSELVALKEQYDEMDDEDHALIGLVDYVTRRLSEKKPERQIERELKALGAVFEKKARKSRVKKDLNSSTHFDSDSHEEKKEPFMKRKRIVVSSDDEGDIMVPTTNEEQKKKKPRLVLSDSEDDI